MQSSGLDFANDAIMSIGAIAVVENKIVVGDSFEAKIRASHVAVSGLDDNEFIPINQNQGLTEQAAIQGFVEFLSNATVVGHRVDLDMELINRALKKMDCGELKNQALDLEVMFRKLKSISENKSIEIRDLISTFNVQKFDDSGELAAAFDLASVFLKLKLRLGF